MHCNHIFFIFYNKTIFYIFADGAATCIIFRSIFFLQYTLQENFIYTYLYINIYSLTHSKVPPMPELEEMVDDF